MPAAAPSGFVGRERELELLTRALATSPSRSTMWLLGGEAGVGKSSLLDELRHRLESGGVTVALGSCLHTADSRLPFVAIVEALRSLAGRFDDGVAAAIAATLPELGRLVPDLAGDAPTTAAESGDSLLPAVAPSQLPLFDAIATFCIGLADRTPVVILLEDLHWADASTRDLLGYLAGRFQGSAATVVGTYRSDEMARSHPFRSTLAALGRHPGVEHLHLEPFDETELRRYAALRLGSAPSQPVLNQLIDRSGGNAFFAAEILDAIAAGRPTPRDHLPDLLTARVDALPPDARAVLRLLAVGGESVRDDLLEEVASRLDGAVPLPAAIPAALREAMEHQVILLSDRGALRFRHALFQEAVYATLLPAERRRMHAAFAAVLEARPDLSATTTGAVAELAWHYLESRQHRQGLVASLKAATLAQERGAPCTAAAHLDAALELWPDVDDAAPLTGCTHLDLLARAASLTYLAGNPARAARLQEAAIAEAEAGIVRRSPDAPDPTRVGLLHGRLGRYLWMAGDGLRASGAYERAAELVPAEPPTTARSEVLAGLGQIRMLTGQPAEETLREAIVVARQADAGRFEGHALNSLGSILTRRGCIVEGFDLLHRALGIAHAEGDTDEIVRAYTNLIGANTSIGRLDTAVALGREGLVISRSRTDTAGAEVFLAANLCDALTELGRWDEAASIMAETSRPESVLPQTWEMHHRFVMASRRGDLATARAVLDRLEPDLYSRIHPSMVPVIEIYRGDLALAEGDVDAALTAATTGLAAAVNLDDRLLLLLLRLRALVDDRSEPDREATAACLAAIEALAVEHRDIDHDLQARALLADARALAADVGGLDQVTAWSEARATWDRGGYVWQRAATSIRLGQGLLRAGRRAEATDVLSDALAAADRLGARPLVESAGALLRHAGLADRTEPGSDHAEVPVGTPNGLTDRELDVLRLVALGCTNRQIGEKLFISAKTVSVHVSRILAKMEAENRTEAASVARRIGLVD